MGKRNIRERFISKPNQPQLEPLLPLTQAQDMLLYEIANKSIILASGSAGTGKTMVSLIRACEMLYAKRINRVVITRPNVETAKSMGALPGDLDEKFDPYMNTMKGMIVDWFGKGWYDCAIKNGNILIQPLGFIQGITYDDTILIVDEAEHLTPREVYIILTRIGQDSKIILCGDSFQKFTAGADGFKDALNRFRRSRSVGIVEFNSDDIVRSGVCKEVVKAYELPV